MKRININDYNPRMGILIDIRDEMDYQKEHHPYSININKDKLVLNHQVYLDKNKKYFIICKNGHRSQRAVSILEYFGYDVTQAYY